MRVDESELRSRLRSMSQEELALLQCSDLTPEGQLVFDEETRQRATERKAAARCPNCESETVADANFCSVAGTRFQARHRHEPLPLLRFHPHRRLSLGPQLLRSRPHQAQMDPALD